MKIFGLIFSIAIILAMNPMSVIAYALNDNSQLDKASLLELIDDGTESITVIQPGSESYNIQSESQARLMERIFTQLAEIVKRLDDWLERVFPAGIQSESKEGILNLNWLVTAIILAILIFFFVSIIPFLRSRYSKGNLSEIDLNNAYLSISMSQALQRSEQLASEQDYYGALQELLKGFLMGLDELNRIPYRRSRTNREYQRLIRRNANSYSKFASDFLPYMEGILYAGINPDPRQYRVYRDTLKGTFGK